MRSTLTIATILAVMSTARADDGWTSIRCATTGTALIATRPDLEISFRGRTEIKLFITPVEGLVMPTGLLFEFFELGRTVTVGVNRSTGDIELTATVRESGQVRVVGHSKGTCRAGKTF